MSSSIAVNDASTGEPIGHEDLLFLHQVLEETCAARGLRRDGEAAEWIAASLIRFYQQGVRDRSRLFDLAVTR